MSLREGVKVNFHCSHCGAKQIGEVVQIHLTKEAMILDLQACDQCHELQHYKIFCGGIKVK